MRRGYAPTRIITPPVGKGEPDTLYSRDDVFDPYKTYIDPRLSMGNPAYDAYSPLAPVINRFAAPPSPIPTLTAPPVPSPTGERPLGGSIKAMLDDIKASNDYLQTVRQKRANLAKTPAPTFKPTPFTDAAPTEEGYMPLPKYDDFRGGQTARQFLPLAALGALFGMPGIQAATAFTGGKIGVQDKTSEDVYNRATDTYKLDTAAKNNRYRTAADIYENRLNVNKSENAANRQAVQLDVQNRKIDEMGVDSEERAAVNEYKTKVNAFETYRKQALQTNEYMIGYLDDKLKYASESGKKSIVADLNKLHKEHDDLIGAPSPTGEFNPADFLTGAQLQQRRDDASMARTEKNIKGRKDVAGMNITSREKITGLLNASREKVAQMGVSGRWSIADLNHEDTLHKIAMALSQDKIDNDSKGLQQTRIYLDSIAKLQASIAKQKKEITTILTKQNADPNLSGQAKKQAAIDANKASAALKTFEEDLTGRYAAGLDQLEKNTNDALHGKRFSGNVAEMEELRVIEESLKSFKTGNMQSSFKPSDLQNPNRGGGTPPPPPSPTGEKGVVRLTGKNGSKGATVRIVPSGGR